MTVLYILLLLMAALLGGAYYAYRISFFVDRNNEADSPMVLSEQYDPYRERMRQIRDTLVAIPYETVRITSFDGLKLTGRYYHVTDGAPLDICFHGYRSNPVIDFSGGSEISFALGHNILMIEQRAHCTSEGHVITFGILERRDLLSWVNYAVDRFGSETKILLYGVSMGGATVLMGSNLPLPENVKAIIADCPYANAADIIAEVGKDQHFPPAVTRLLATLGARVFGHFDLHEMDALRAVKDAKIPILIIHGDDDRFVPCAMSEQVWQANPKMVTRYTIPTAAHGIAYLVDTPFYTEKVCAFLEKHL